MSSTRRSGTPWAREESRSKACSGIPSAGARSRRHSSEAVAAGKRIEPLDRMFRGPLSPVRPGLQEARACEGTHEERCAPFGQGGRFQGVERRACGEVRVVEHDKERPSGRAKPKQRCGGASRQGRQGAGSGAGRLQERRVRWKPAEGQGHGRPCLLVDVRGECQLEYRAAGIGRRGDRCWHVEQISPDGSESVSLLGTRAGTELQDERFGRQLAQPLREHSREMALAEPGIAQNRCGRRRAISACDPGQIDQAVEQLLPPEQGRRPLADDRGLVDRNRPGRERDEILVSGHRLERHPRQHLGRPPGGERALGVCGTGP